MKRVAVFSDTHGDISAPLRILPGLGKVDLLLFLGDVAADGQDLHRAYPDIPFTAVRGNNDWFSPLPDVAEAEIAGVKILCTHGHLMSPGELRREMKKRGCRVGLFGHTHQGYLERFPDGSLIMNPGSPSRPRDRRPSCGIIEIEGTEICADLLPLL